MRTHLLQRVTTFAGFAAFVLACTLAAASDKRVALLVGNNAYPQAPLRNAVNDSRDLGAALRTLGFEVTVRENLSRRELIETLRAFGDSIQGAEAALFFYAGHALQFKDRNFLLPIDAEVLAEDDIALFGLDLAVVFDRMERARTRRNLIILDACRNNPFEGTFKLAAQGLAQASAPSGTLIAYATAPGSVASDGAFDRNGVYTKHILKQIGVPEQPVEIMFKRVREGVEKETKFRQTPWDASSLRGDFVFASGSRAAAPAAPTATAAGPSVDVMLQIEREFWISVKDSNNREELQAYLDHYPQGKFVTLAKLRLQNLPRGSPGEAGPKRSSIFGAPIRVAMWGPLAQAAAARKPMTLQDFFRPAEFADMKLSPDGKHLAALAPFAGRQNLVVMDTATLTPRALSERQSVDIVSFDWVNDRRLVMKTGTVRETQARERGGGLFAIDIDGRNLRQLSEGIGETRREGQAVLRMLQFVRALPRSDDILAQEIIVAGAEGSASYADVLRVNTRTGQRVALSAGKAESGRIEMWVVDKDGVARAQHVMAGAAARVHYRAGAEAPWRKLAELPVSEPGWEPLSVAEDGKSLYIRSWQERDKASIVLLDPESGSRRLIASHPYVDVNRMLYDYGTPVGVAYDADRPSQAWFDEELERIQATVDNLLPRATNELSWSRSRDFVLVKSSSDTWPGSYYLFNRQTGRMRWLVDTHPWVQREAMSPKRPVRYRARDGLEIPAYLTMPRGTQAKAPLVVLVHNRVWDEGVSWRFDAEVQYLASRGFAVLQPNFRGTQRYGWKHLRAGFKQWGRAMQDDLADAVAWAVAQGHADASRVCIYGAGYGGYAALVGATADPPLYKCAASFGAITDLPAYLESPGLAVSWLGVLQYTLKEMIGDPEREEAALAAVSPRRRAEKAAAPIFIAHGIDDLFVPFDQADIMKSALQRVDKPLRWLPIADEGHALRDPGTIARFYGALDEFLRENLLSASR